MEEKKNGSHAGNASGTVSAVSSLTAPHNNTAFSISQVGIYSKAEEVAVNAVVEKARQSGDLHTYPLSVLADEINDTMRQIVDQANVPAKQGGRELGWPKPKGITGVQAAMLVFEYERIRMVCTKETVDKEYALYRDMTVSKVLCFGNGALTALHDRSDGFFRRQIVLTTKDRPADRVDDPYLVEKMKAEKEGIFLWCLEGLNRLIANNYQFTVSVKAKENIQAIVKDANNILEFLGSEGYLSFHPDSEASTRALYEAYKTWCEDNAEITLSAKSFANQMAQHADAFHLTADNNIYIGRGKRCRGYHGVEVSDPDNPFLER